MPDLLFFYQSPVQQILLNRYGSTVYIAEIVQPSELGSRVAVVAIYLMVVRTNVDYQVVGTIVVNKYSKENVKKALVKCKEVNDSWSPKYFMVDKDDEHLLLPITELFPGLFNLSFVLFL